MTPRLTSARLLLRPHAHDDLKSSVNLFTDPEVMRFVSDGIMSWPASTGIFRKVFGLQDHSDHDVWAVCTAEDGRYIGSAELKPRPGTDDFEIAYVLGRPHWGQGYATEIAARLLAYAFEDLGLRRVTATVDSENSAAIRVLEKLGFRIIGEGVDEDPTALIYGVDNPHAARAAPAAAASAG
ncbi:MAG: GNAT family N-acetyltransferase [Polyangiaceae bacterium]|nr:GNAT family N-acetyltransferase [Polyangiaceae bacterium]